MSTFDGAVREFPSIQIDYFRKNPDRPPPLACFLSHVHSDHLQGLESFRTTFIYCSPATREMLLRIEKYPHRMNFSKGILESRRLHYKHLSKLLRPIPLNTPTELELTPRLSIRVTLFDANHCTGAVMFLVEGNGKAILYTGDIRAEPWWVNSITRHPVLIPYTLGNKRLDNIYIDNTFAHPSHLFHAFPSKAEGLKELLAKVQSYPDNTTFYFRAWTFGYEEVWMALSAALNSKVHVDRYQIDLYRSLASQGVSDAPFLCGYELGNRFVSGCLSEDESSRIHSCEPGVHCRVAASRNTVYIAPIVNRTMDGSEMPEIGAGGGGGDLYQVHELELQDQSALEKLEKLCLERIHDIQALSQTRQALVDAFRSKTNVLSLDTYGMKDAHEMSLESFISILSRGRPDGEDWSGNVNHHTHLQDKQGNPLPRIINFPYSRHSSYDELCDLVSAFKPKDVHPCTVDPMNWDEGVSIQTLFGQLCSGTEFAHDQYMRDMTANDPDLRARKRARYEGSFRTQSSQQTSSGIDSSVPEHPQPTTPEPLSSSSDQIPLPSSLDPINEPTPIPINEPLTIPASTPGAAKARRDEIRRAWHILNNADPPERSLYDLGPLPSSWTTTDEEEISPTPHSLPERPLKIKDKHIPVTPTSPSITNPEPQNTSIDDHPEDPNSSSQPQPNSQLSQSLSLSSSAFKSQECGQNSDHHHYQDSDEEDITAIPSYDGTDDRPRRQRQDTRRSISTQIRRDAYLAARADSFDAWASVSLMSTGNNHTEEEIEL
ncbi:DNA repair protein [Aspergillus sclerotioniger CBS 115572]|uniref:Protein artemis n=1 Tax=Aspergillus sclerotioniger CBS 115572 TaxID=1450535 RepID=A0A317XDA9_9EURO|nr:DNA repair protein [Aspergillus sclerotioniger CBS 115572]PWY95587.1 DNA repair protein [Aspergillus sclerotioniger CBS 115572]